MICFNWNTQEWLDKGGTSIHMKFLDELKIMKRDLPTWDVLCTWAEQEHPLVLSILPSHCERPNLPCQWQSERYSWLSPWNVDTPFVWIQPIRKSLGDYYQTCHGHVHSVGISMELHFQVQCFACKIFYKFRGFEQCQQTDRPSQFKLLLECYKYMLIDNSLKMECNCLDTVCVEIFSPFFQGMLTLILWTLSFKAICWVNSRSWSFTRSNSVARTGFSLSISGVTKGNWNGAASKDQINLTDYAKVSHVSVLQIAGHK